MRFFLTVIFLLLIYSSSDAQYQALSDYYVSNPLLINPSLSGSQENLSVGLNYRNQWVGFEGTPKTFTATVDAPVFFNKIGIGLGIRQDQIAISKETQIITSYAYRIKLYNGIVAIGIGANFKFFSANWSQLKINDVEETVFTQDVHNQLVTNFGIGTFYSTKKYFLGFSIPLLLHEEYEARSGMLDTKIDFAEINYFLTGGGILKLNENLNLFPSLMLRYGNINDLQLELNSHLIIKKKLWMGLSYRTKETMTLILQFQLNKQLKIGYASNINLGFPGLENSDSHEIMVKYNFNYLLEVANPRSY